jgi:hypothetical protein
LFGVVTEKIKRVCVGRGCNSRLNPDKADTSDEEQIL